MEKRFLSVKEACEAYGVCRNTLLKYAEQAGAVRHIGSRVLLDTEWFNTWMRKNAFLDEVSLSN